MEEEEEEGKTEEENENDVWHRDLLLLLWLLSAALNISKPLI